MESNIPAHILWTDEDPESEKAMAAEVETADNITTVEKGRPQLTHPVKDPDARQDTVKQQNPKEGQDAGQIAQPGNASTDQEIVTHTEVPEDELNRKNETGKEQRPSTGTEKEQNQSLITADTLTFTSITKTPSRRAITANVRDILIVNIYAPSGTAKRQEREMFFNSELAYLLGNVSDNLLLGGDFNCVFENPDSTGQYNFSRSLADLVQGYALKGTLQANLVHKVHTHYTASVANRLHRISSHVPC